MDGQNFNGGSQQNNYQDNTANMSYYAPVAEDVPHKANGMQIGGMVLGILSICLVCCYGYPSIILGVIGLILAIAGNKRGKHGIGTAGLICSIIGIVLGVISAVYYTAIIAEILRMMQNGEFDLYEYYYQF